MQNKDRYIIELHKEIIKRFGPDAFLAIRSEMLGSNHAVYSRQPDGRIEISVVAGGEGQSRDKYSVQVEFDIRKPDFDVPFAKENLSLEEVLAIFNKFS